MFAAESGRGRKLILLLLKYVMSVRAWNVDVSSLRKWVRKKLRNDSVVIFVS